ncbi:protein rigor mortis [Culex quinquefasciatus]|nr:protein rigor mortis [Culex quinquefasciatus]
MEDGSVQQTGAQLSGADMDGFVVPSGYSWYRQNAFLCTPDNGLLYHSRYDVNYVSPLEVDQMPRVQIMNVRATVKSLACSQDWTERREFATLDDQNNLLVWDLEVGLPVKGHKGHVYKAHGGGPRYSDEVNSAICFTRTQKVLSAEHSLLIVYCLATDTYKIYAELFRDTVVLLSPCPDDRNVFAAGLRRGLIVLFSLKDMTVLYNMRGHDREVVSIDWMQVPVLPEDTRANWRREERPKKEARKKKVEKEVETEAAATAAAAVDNSDIFDIYEYNESQEEFGTIVDKQTSSFDKKDRFFDKVHTTEGFNFLEECQNLKKDIIKAKEEQDLEGEEDEGEGEKQAATNSDDENELDEAEKLRDYIIVDGDGEEEQDAEPKKEAVMRTIIVSGSRENIIFFWDYKTGLQIDRIVLHSSGANKRMTPGIFITPVFANPWKVVANTNVGHVFEWTISFSFRDTQVRMKTKQNPVRYPVDMAVCLQRARAPIAAFDPKCGYVWCQTTLRKILGLCVTGQPAIVVDYTCMTTGHECVVESPLESTILAVGCTDKKLVTVNLATLAYNDVNCVPYMNKVGSSVTALDWHPEKENLIAFGTLEGRIGLLDTGSSNNVPIMLNPFQTTKVYSLKWCQLSSDGENESTMILMATGQAKSAFYKMTGAGKYDPIELRQFGMVSCVSASDRHLFVGTNGGVVYVADLCKDFTKLFQRNIASRYISSLQFKDGVLAVSSNDSHIRLIDFSNGIDDKVEDNVRLLEGHASGVCNVRWGHGDSKLLVSASFDNTVRVWDTTTASCLAVYHSVESVFCAIFSPIHENIVIFVGKGTTLAFVDYTKHPPQPDGGKKNKLAIKWAVAEERNDKRAIREKKRAGKPLSDLEKSIGSMRISDKAGSATPPQSNGHAEPQPELVTPSDVSAPAVNTKQVNQLADRMEQVKFQEIEPRVETLKANMTSLFHLSQREINRPADVLACIGKLVNYEEPNEDYPEEEEEVQEAAPKPEEVKQPQTNERRYHLEKLFTAEKDLRELIDEETKYHHVTHTASIGTILLPQVGFRLKEQIIERIASKTLTDQLLALAPSISYEFWRKCSEAYAYQLLEKKYPLAAIPYFLASHKITEAIENLCQHKYYREAWVICKLRKAADDPVREKVCTEWAQYLETTGNLEGAALVWTAAKQYKNAVAVLSKRKDITEDIKRAVGVLNDKLQQLAVAE